MSNTFTCSNLLVETFFHFIDTDRLTAKIRNKTLSVHFYGNIA